MLSICSSSNRYIGLKHLQWYYYLINFSVTFISQTPEEFRHDMSDILGYNITVNDETYTANGYDAIWALALALDEAESVLSRGLDSYQYGDEEYARIVGKSILNQTFVGMSVSIFKIKYST